MRAAQDDFEVSGLFTVTEVDDERVTLAPAGSIRGGQSVALPISEFPEPAVISRGAVLRGTVMRSGEDYLIELDRVGEATFARIRYVKGGWEFSRAGAKVRAPFPEGLDTASCQKAERAEFWAFRAPIDGHEGHFADLDGYLAELRAQEASSAAKDEEKRQDRLRAAWISNRESYDEDSFINPYNFVPLPDSPPQRQAPIGHGLRRGDRLHGRIDVTFTAKSPVLVRDSGGVDGRSGALPRRRGAVVIPGSSVKGALRSVFEALTGSCLRVVDLEFIPAYRDVLRAANRSGWSLIEVVDVDRQSRPRAIRKSTGKPIWFSLEVLQSVLGAAGVKTGAQFVLTGQSRTAGKGAASREEVRDPKAVAPVGARGRTMTLLVTDVRARPARKGVCFVAAELAPDVVTATPTDAAWRRFQAALDGATDVKRGTGLNVEPDGFIKVPIQKKSTGTGYRQVQGVVKGGKGEPKLGKGHVLWARVEGNEITELAFAHTWRHGANGADLLDRIPPGFHPCTGSDGLCPACRVFGSANTRGAEGGADQPYRGHVRFEDWSVECRPERIELAPLGSPRPGSGQMYLDHRESPPQYAARDGEVPLREWGSALDGKATRKIRGRKFYWRTSDAPGSRPPRYKLHRSQKGDENKGSMTKQVELIPAGSEIRGSLTFENLSPAGLGAILVALDPGRIREFQHPNRDPASREFCFTVGGGKPLGLGALELTSLRIASDGAAQRYTGEPTTPIDPDQAVSAFVDSVPDPARATWPALLEMLRWDAVNPAMVSYPREGPWPANPLDDDPKLYEAGFDWWTRSAGMPPDGLGGKGEEQRLNHSYVTLPGPTDPRVTLPIDIQQPTGD